MASVQFWVADWTLTSLQRNKNEWPLLSDSENWQYSYSRAAFVMDNTVNQQILHGKGSIGKHLDREICVAGLTRLIEQFIRLIGNAFA